MLEIATCTRCGCPIKYVYDFDGKPYGSTCIEVVSGFSPDSWVWIDGHPDYEATKKTEAKREAERQAFIYNNTVLEEQRKSIREDNQAKFFELINVLNQSSRYPGDFCSITARKIARDGSSNDLYEILGHERYNIVLEIWGKWDGRKGSKKYKTAVDEFYRKFGDMEE